MSTKVSKKIDEQSDAQLPEPRKGKVVRHDIQLPLQNTSLATVIYWIAGALLLYLSYYVYLVNRWKNDAGGWYNFGMGRHAPPPESSDAPAEAVPFGSGTTYESAPGNAGEQLSSRIAELAEQLGIAEPEELASAIKPLVHPTKIEAILDAEPEETGVPEGTDGKEKKERTLVDVIVEDEREKRKLAATVKPLGWMEAVVGMDEPPTEMPV